MSETAAAQEIVLIRHGETAWNAERRLQGHLDIGLNAHGLRQAAALATALQDEVFDAVYCSDLLRARQTAQALAAERSLPLQVDAGLRERCYGAFEGMLYADIAGRYPAAHAAWQARDVDARFPAGQWAAETLHEFSERALAAVMRLASLAQTAGQQRIVIVTHGGVLESVYRGLRGIGQGPARDFEIPNTGINRLRRDGAQLRIERWADVSHLQRLAPVLDEIDV